MKDSGARPDHSQRNAAANKKTYRQKTGRHLPNDRNVFSKDTNGKTTACTKKSKENIPLKTTNNRFSCRSKNRALHFLPQWKRPAACTAGLCGTPKNGGRALSGAIPESPRCFTAQRSRRFYSSSRKKKNMGNGSAGFDHRCQIAAAHFLILRKRIQMTSTSGFAANN